MTDQSSSRDSDGQTAAPVKPSVSVTVAGEGSNKRMRLERAIPPTASFSLPAPDQLTVQQQLEYYSRYADSQSLPLYLRLWTSALSLIEDWSCEVLPDPRVNLKTVTNPDITMVIMWAGQEVLGYIEGLDLLPKVLSKMS